ncbi:hypothetical protein FEDK69T_07430 [Flavobacterium enshiense DK69]|uniref:Zinc metalloprotease n=1 Tax=Flavobacterium enshiense DK69 TaxID=1107311 RepID=V6SCG7_9FLAO|nr:M12 family metallo-peptidase [Flavobacterium enshiense]ESU24301.1 hypothetical protein FEDK69T_07430 [Flavobacterium enshiense DK69]KGO95327.1 hypothetical protein Q767_10995 [Flavobacterium enshiense DK69]
MKKLTTILALLCCFFAFSQNKVASKIRELNLSKTKFVPVFPLTPIERAPNTQIEKTVADAQLATIKTAVVNDVVANGYETIEVQIPYHGSMIDIQLYKVDLFSEGFHVDTDKQKYISYDRGAYYRGIIKNDPSSLVSFNFFNGEFNGVVSSSLLSNLVVGKIDAPGNVNEYVIYEDQKMKVASPNECHTKDEVTEYKDHKSGDSRTQSGTKCVATYFEIDNNLFVANGSNTTTTTNWMTSVFNNMQTLYANDGITLALKTIYIWTSQDPYEGAGSDPSDYLYKFKDVRPVFDGDVGQLVGIDAGNLGGVSMGIGGLCTTNNYVYSDVFLSYSTVPTYSWTIMVVTHEFGHNVGSRHTHACAWNGDNTAIDNCGPFSIPNGEGTSCMTTPPTIPSGSEKGTIMSYCHLVGGVGINLANGFGPQPANAILDFIDSRACLSTDCISVCVNGVGAIDAQYNAVSTSAVVSWTDITNEDTWQVAVMPFSSNLPSWTTVTSPTFTANGLTPNTYYKFRVKPNCGSLTPLTREFVFLTSANYCNGITLTDTGGAAGNYRDNQNFVRTIVPNVPNNKIKLTFSSFSLERDYDYLYVYNGSSTSSPAFAANGYTGTTVVPGPFESTAPDGALTLKFYSDGGTTDRGWVATTSCLANLGLDENNYLDYSYYPNPTNGLVTINSKDIISNVMVYNVEGRLLYSGDVNNLTAQVDISGYASGTYFFKMNIDNQIVNFKIVKL